MGHKVEKLLDAYAAAQQELEKMDALWASEAADILEQVPHDLRMALEQVAEARRKGITRLEQSKETLATQIKSAVGAAGQTVSHSGWQAIYRRGRALWDDTFLQGYAVAYPEILNGRSEGQPSVSLRRTKEERTDASNT